jgi:hypothetical protein
MAQYTIEGVAKGARVRDLWDWYTDFRSDDPKILEREGVRAGKSLYRNITKDGNRIHIDQAGQAGKRTIEMSLDITLHPENMTYDVADEIKGFFNESRRYVFTETPEGAKVEANVTAQPLRFVARLFGGMVRRGSQQVMSAYLRAAEKDLTEKTR